MSEPSLALRLHLYLISDLIIAHVQMYIFLLHGFGCSSYVPEAGPSAMSPSEPQVQKGLKLSTFDSQQ